MKERPILFSAPMVRAILDGSKTQTRRIVKGLDPDRLLETMTRAQHARIQRELPEAFGARYFCPFGQPGDRLWVKETHSFVPDAEEPAGCSAVLYAADGERYGKLRPSIHMPRAASRMLLEVVSVRVERLLDISEADAKAEGVHEWARGACAAGNPKGYTDVGYYSLLWEQINGSGSWNANPWVWVVAFRAIACEGPRA